MRKWLIELKDFFESTFEFTKGYTIIEVLCIALLGLSSSQSNELLSPWSLLIVVSCIILIITYIQRYKFLNKFPKSLIDSVEQSLDLKEVEIQRKESEIERLKVLKSKERGSLINDAISDTIVGLNSQTCSLSEREDPFEEVVSKLCDKDVEDGLIQILSPFISEIYTIVQTDDAQITLGVYFKDIAQDTGGDGSIPTSNPMLIIVKDDNNLKNKIPFNLLEDHKITGDLQLLQQLFETCLRNNRFISTKLILYSEALEVMVSPIPYACDETTAHGAMVLIAKNSELPKDIEKITKVFNRLLTNWMYKYNSCVYGRSSTIWTQVEYENGEKIILYNNGRYKFIPAKKS